MTPQDQAKQLTDKIVASLSRITEYPDCWLPHSVWVEEVDDTGTPTYRHYMLEKIRPDGTCDLYNPNTGKLEHDDCHLSEINIDWLVVLWNRYIELCIEQGMWKDRAVEILQEQTDADEMTIREFVDEHWQNLLLDEDNVEAFKQWTAASKNYPRELYAFIWSCNFMDRNVSDEEIIEAWKEGASRSKNDESDEEFYEVERLTPDELAERINDECFAYAEDYVRFIEMEE